MSGIHRDVRELLQRAEARGWIVSNTANRHLRLEHPAVPAPIFASRRCDARGLANVRAMLIKAEREAGLLAKPPPEPGHQAGESPGEKLHASGGVARALGALMQDFPEHAGPVRMVDGVNLALPIYGAVPRVEPPRWTRSAESGPMIDQARAESVQRLLIPGHRFVTMSEPVAETTEARPEDVAREMAAFARSLGLAGQPLVIKGLARPRRRDHATRIRGRWRNRDD